MLFNVNLLTFVDLFPINLDVGVFLELGLNNNLLHTRNRCSLHLLGFLIESEFFTFLFFLLLSLCFESFFFTVLCSQVVAL